MEIFHRRKLNLITLSLVCLLLGCQHSNEDKINGHWYGLYGDEDERYGEVIFYNGKACYYSTDFGLQYRSYIMVNDSLISFYDGETLDHYSKVKFVDKQTMLQSIIIDGNSIEDNFLTYHRLKESDIDNSRLFQYDTAEQYKFIKEYSFRENKLIGGSE